jgi:hypothetical protein
MLPGEDDFWPKRKDYSPVTGTRRGYQCCQVKTTFGQKVKTIVRLRGPDEDINAAR